MKPRESDKSPAPIVWIIGVAAVGAFVLLALVIANSDWIALGMNRLASPPLPPRVSLSVLIDGQVVNGSGDKPVNVVQGAILTPQANVDWGTYRPGNVRLTLNGQEIQAGEPIPMSTLGVSTLQAEVFTEKWTTGDSMTFEITGNPRHQATAAVHQIAEVDTGEMEIDIRLASTEFNIEDIYLSHVTLWLLDDSNRTLDRLSVAKASAGDSRQPEYQARFQDGFWIMHFVRRADAPPVNAARIMVTGSGWERDQHIEFASEPIALKKTGRE